MILRGEEIPDDLWEFFEPLEPGVKSDVLSVPTQPYSGAHFAVFPEALVEPCILAGSRPGDVVFDPFAGSGTVCRVAERLGRRWLGCELSMQYAELIQQRTAQIGIGI